MKRKPMHLLSRRERQIMEVIYATGSASVAEVRAALPDPPSYSAVRAQLRLLEEKGHLRHRQQGRRYIFIPTLAPAQARRSALQSLMTTFFNGSVEQVVASLLDLNARNLSDEEFNRLAELIRKAQK